jgi:carbonic anhydrase
MEYQHIQKPFHSIQVSVLKGVAGLVRVRNRRLLANSMCEQCSDHSRNHSPDLARRTFLKLASAVAFSSAFSIRSEAAESGAPPKPHNVLSPKEALDRLMAGNDRYVKGITKRHDFISERPALTLGQNPFAGILGCADSRVGPEYAFDVGLGDVFVCRGAAISPMCIRSPV